MSIIKEFSRRIEKFFTGNTTPTIPEIGSTHLDTEWKSTDIYQGELALNLNTGNIYSSDGKKIIHLNRNDNYIISGMVLSKPDNSFSANIPFWLDISSGEISINNKHYIWNNESIGGGVLELEQHTQSKGRIDYVFAILEDDGSGNDQIAFTTVSSYDDNDLEGSPTISVPNDSVFLGVVYVPEGYNSSSTYSLGMYSTAGLHPSYPVINFEPFDFVQKILKSTLYYKQYQFYYKNQLVIESYINTNYDPDGSPTQDNVPTILSLWGASKTSFADGSNPISNGNLFSPISGGSGAPGVSVDDAVVVNGTNVGDYPGANIGDLLIIKSDNTIINAGSIANSSYIHTQSIASSEWNINHNLGLFPNVTIVDSSYIKIYADVEYIDDNNIRITFSEPLTGEAYLS